MSKEKNVKIFVDRIPGDTDENVVVAINGKTWLLPKGKSSEVPESVAYEYERSLRARRYSVEHVTRIIENNREKEKESEEAAV